MFGLCQMNPSWIDDTRSLILDYKQGLLSEFILIAYTWHCYCTLCSTHLNYTLIFLFCFLLQLLKRALSGHIVGENMPSEKRETSLYILSGHRPWVYHQKVSLESTGKDLSSFRDSELQSSFWG